MLQSRLGSYAKYVNVYVYVNILEGGGAGDGVGGGDDWKIGCLPFCFVDCSFIIIIILFYFFFLNTKITLFIDSKK